MPGRTGLAPVGAPFVDDGAHVEKPVSVGSPSADLPRSAERALGDLSVGDLFSPGGPRRDEPSVGSKLPFLFRRETTLSARHPAKPDAIRRGLLPGDANNRLERRAEIRIVPPRRRDRFPD